MTIRYSPASDMLYIKVAPGPSHESEEVAPDVVVDLDADGRVVGFEVEHASRRFELGEVVLAIDETRMATLRFVERVPLAPGRATQVEK